MSPAATSTPAAAPVAEPAPAGRPFPAVLRDYYELVRPRIVGLVLFTMVIAAVVSSAGSVAWLTLLHAVSGSTLVIIGAIALNARLERASDVKMVRTAGRPLPAGRLPQRQVAWFGAITSVVGGVYLAALVNGWIVVLAVVSWIVYVWIYTPLKIFTAWQTPIGAVAGAMPVLLGSAAVGEPFNTTALALFGVIYLWQFPHAMAIAWLYRRDFAAADLRVATVVDPSGRTAARLAVFGAIALIPVSMVPVFVGTAGWAYGSIALLLGIAYLLPSLLFWSRRNDIAARLLLRISFAYVPVVFLAILLAV
ncbi:MAG: protoheme IX farnesyltransferase [Pirellulales bacterium]|nr:protoheme IX farnesyltransferase [Pirellulales bacterium]